MKTIGFVRPLDRDADACHPEHVEHGVLECPVLPQSRRLFRERPLHAVYRRGNTNWTIGIDNSDLDKFKIATGGGSLGTGDVLTITTGGLVSIPKPILADASNDVQWGRPLVALGGGAAATLGTIGGSGPATAAQNKWMRVLDDAGAAFWVPAWK